jgi:tRNA G10  N-methylase Trm11
MIYQLNLSKRGSVSEMDSESCLSIGNSTAIPLDDNSVDAVITSPPYCTRIDYTIATSLELALLGYDYKEHVKDLRQSTIGSPVINKKPIELKREWGKTCLDILDKIYSHSAKASKSYYFKTYLQYFSSIYLSLIEIDRTLLNGGRCILVVQDSYYKEILVNLPIVFTEMMETLDWTLIFKEDYQCKQSMIGLNTRSNNYRSKTYTTESVLMLYKKAKEI